MHLSGNVSIIYPHDFSIQIKSRSFNAVNAQCNQTCSNVAMFINIYGKKPKGYIRVYETVFSFI